MAIRMIDPIPITFDAGAPSANGSDLGIDCVGQLNPRWCWAACVQMVLAHRHTSVDQCTIVNSALRRNDCCPNGSAGVCSVALKTRPDGGAEPDLFTLLQSFGVQARHEFGAPSPSAIKAALGDGPVAVCFEASATNGHVVLLTGWQPSGDATDPILIVNDPQTVPPQQAFVSYTDVRAGMGLGIGGWQETIVMGGGA